jgi:hypothetical protein
MGDDVARICWPITASAATGDRHIMADATSCLCAANVTARRVFSKRDFPPAWPATVPEAPLRLACGIERSI